MSSPRRRGDDAAGNRTSVIDGSDSEYSDCGWIDDVTWQPGWTGTEVEGLLAQAVDFPGWSFTTSGNAAWSDSYNASHTGDPSAQSGDIDDTQESWMQPRTTGPGTISFWWKVSSEGYCDPLEFWVDGVRRDYIGGEADWAQVSYAVTGEGTHTFKWRYVKDGSISEGDDCGWVDGVQWTGYFPEPDPDRWLTLTYTYDAEGRRIAKKYDGQTILTYVYDGDRCIAEYDSSNNLRRKYIYGPGIDEPICMVETMSASPYAGTYYYHFDALGSVVALTNASGNTVEVYEYDVFGRVGSSDPNHPNRFLFTGREYDKETGLYYYRARYYKPEIGRFLQVDPVGYEAGLNLYRYCSNNPWNHIDPFGRDPCDSNCDSNDLDLSDPCDPYDPCDCIVCGYFICDANGVCLVDPKLSPSLAADFGNTPVTVSLNFAGIPGEAYDPVTGEWAGAYAVGATDVAPPMSTGEAMTVGATAGYLCVRIYVWATGGAKSIENYNDHVEKYNRAKKKWDDVKNAGPKSRKCKDVKAWRDELNKISEEIRGHQKEMKQKWPGKYPNCK
jgi:RHS repeat-associated protein